MAIGCRSPTVFPGSRSDMQGAFVPSPGERHTNRFLVRGGRRLNLKPWSAVPACEQRHVVRWRWWRVGVDCRLDDPEQSKPWWDR